MVWLLLAIIVLCGWFYWSAALRLPAVRQFHSLVVINCKNMYRPRVKEYRDQEQDDWRLFMMSLSGVALFAAMLYLAYMLVRLGIAIGQAELVYVTAILAVSIILFLWGLSQLASTLYFSRDNDLLLSLPLPAPYIVGAKLVAVLLGQYAVAFVVFFPALMFYAVELHVGGVHWLVGLLVLLLLPILPLLLALLVLLPLARYLDRRLREWLVSILSLLGVIIGLCTRLVDFNQAGSSAMTLLENWQASGYDIVSRLGRFFPPSVWATRALALAGTWVGLEFLLLFVGAIVLAGAAVYLLSSRVYLHSVVGADELIVAKPRLVEAEQAGGERRLLKALLWREWQLLRRTPLFLLDSLTSLSTPVLFLILAYQKGTQATLAPLLTAISASAPGVMALSIGGLMAVTAFSNRVASAGVSREGQRFYISKVIPVDYRLQIKSKLLLAFVAVSLPSFLVVLLWVIWVKPDLLDVLLGLLLGSLASWYTVNLTLAHDLADPVLDWKDPKQALKGMGKKYARLILLGVMAVAAAMVYLLRPYYTAALICIILLLAALSIYQHQQLLHDAAILYDRIEL